MFMMIAAKRLVKRVANRIRCVAVPVIDCLVKGMFLRENLLAFCWMDMGREAREAGLMSGVWVQWVLP